MTTRTPKEGAPSMTERIERIYEVIHAKPRLYQESDLCTISVGDDHILYWLISAYAAFEIADRHGHLSCRPWPDTWIFSLSGTAMDQIHEVNDQMDGFLLHCLAASDPDTASWIIASRRQDPTP